MGVTRVIRKKSNDERTVWEAFKEFQIEKKILGIEEKTIQNYEQSIKRFMTGMKWDDIQLMELEQSDIMKFIANLQEQELSTETINHYLRDLRAFFNWCSHIGYMEKIEVKMVKGQEVFKETFWYSASEPRSASRRLLSRVRRSQVESFMVKSLPVSDSFSLKSI